MHFAGKRLEKTLDRRFVHIERQCDAQPSGSHRNRRRTNGPHVVAARTELCREVDGGLILSNHNWKYVRARCSKAAVPCEFASCILDQSLKRGTPGIAALAERNCGAGDRSEKRRWRGGKDERPAAIDQEVREDARPADVRARSAESLPASVYRHDVVATLQERCATPTVGSEDAGGMRVVNDEHRFSTARKRIQFRKIGSVSVHAVETFNGDPDAPRPTSRAPPNDGIIDGLRVIVARADDFGSTAAQSIVHTRMNPLVVNYEITALRRRGEQGEIRGIAAAEIQRRLRAEVGTRGLFQSLMLHMIAAQESRSAGADRYLTGQRLARSGAQFARIRERQIIVGGKIKTAEALQRPPLPTRRKAIEGGLEVGERSASIRPVAEYFRLQVFGLVSRSNQRNANASPQYCRGENALHRDSHSPN